jgi:hypothetical protein
MAVVYIGEGGVLNGAMIPIIWVPAWDNVVHVMAVSMQGRAVTAPVANHYTVEAKPPTSHIHIYQVTWTTPSCDNWRWAVDGI